MLFITRTTVIHNVRYILPVSQIIVWSRLLTKDVRNGRGLPDGRLGEEQQAK
jgi:hypothetical protein